MANIFRIDRPTNTITLGTAATIINPLGTFYKTSTLAAGLNVLRVTGLQTDATALTGTLRGAYIDVSNGSTAATGTIRALELKARTEAPGDTGNNVAVLEGLSISADSKAHDVTTMRAAEFILDGKTGGTIDEAVGLRIANNLQVDKATTSYGLQIYRDSFDYTADIQLSDGSVINKGGNWGIGTATPDTKLQVVGDCKFGDDDTNYIEIGITGDTKFVGGAGLPFGSCYGNHIGWSQAAAAQNTWYNISDSDILDGNLHNITHDGNGKLTVANAGMYLVAYSICFEDDAANDHIEAGIEISGSGSANAAGQCHLENKFANEEEYMSSSTILDLVANATLEIAIRTTDAVTPTISVQAINITCVQIGGT